MAAAFAMLSSSMVVIGATAAEPWSAAQGVTNGPFTFFVRGQSLSLSNSNECQAWMHTINPAFVPDGFHFCRRRSQAHRCNYTTAESHCGQIGGHLATILTPAENNAVHQLCHAEECWIGASYELPAATRAAVSL